MQTSKYHYIVSWEIERDGLQEQKWTTFKEALEHYCYLANRAKEIWDNMAGILNRKPVWRNIILQPVRISDD